MPVHHEAAPLRLRDRPVGHAAVGRARPPRRRSRTPGGGGGRGRRAGRPCRRPAAGSRRRRRGPPAGPRSARRCARPGPGARRRPRASRVGMASPSSRAVQRLQDRLALGRAPHAVGGQPAPQRLGPRPAASAPMIRPHDHGPGDADAWAAHARGRVADAGHRTGGARSAVITSLAEQSCCRSAQEIFDQLRERRPPGGHRERLPGARPAGEPGAGAAPRPGRRRRPLRARDARAASTTTTWCAWTAGRCAPSRTTAWRRRSRGPPARRTSPWRATTWSCAGAARTAGRRSAARQVRDRVSAPGSRR